MSSPLHSAETLRQYDAARTRSAVFDLSNYAKIQLTGPDARFFLHNLCTNDVKNLIPGQGCEAFLTTNKARVIAHTLVGCFEEQNETVLRLDSVPGTAETVAKHLNHFLISEQVEVTDRTRDFAMYHVCGPQAKAALAKMIHELPDSLPSMHHITSAIQEKAIYVRRNDRLALPGYDVICASDLAPETFTMLQREALPAGAAAFEILRIEAGIPEYGKDIDENRLVMEVGRTAQAISYTKGCYLGQEPIVMARDRGHVNRVFAGVKVAGGEVVRSGTKLHRDGTDVGEVTSSTISPRLDAPLALAYLRRGHTDPGTAMTLDDGREAVVVSVPLNA